MVVIEGKPEAIEKIIFFTFNFSKENFQKILLEIYTIADSLIPLHQNKTAYGM